jgi:Tol biopolymer transport system component
VACQGWVKESGPEPVIGNHSVLDCPGTLSIRIFKSDESFGTDWSPITHRLVFNKKTEDGFQNLFTSLPDGSDERSITYENPIVPGKHACSPVWTPDGQFIVFSAEKKEHGRGSIDAFCGFGAYNDIWIIRADGKKAWQLTNVANDYDHGAMIPRFSRDGAQLLWTQRVASPNIFVPAQAFGSWEIAVASLHFTNGEPSIDGVRTLQPGPRGFYEGADFTPDGRGVLFTSSLATDNAWKSQLFTVELATGKLDQLTSGDYNEHGRYTPDGTQILWMSSTGADLKGTDWWLMNADGSKKKRLTFFETSGHPQSSGTALYPGTAAFDETGKWFIGDIETNLLSQSYTRVRVICP